MGCEGVLRGEGCVRGCGEGVLRGCLQDYSLSGGSFGGLGKVSYFYKIVILELPKKVARF